MSRVSQILIGMGFLFVAFVFLLLILVDDDKSTRTIRIMLALLCGILGVACILTWGRPYTTRIAMGLLSLSTLGMALAILFSNKREFKAAAFAGMIALMSGTYAVTGLYPDALPLSKVFGKHDSEEDEEE
jgi:hypothetical protein